MTLLWRFCMKRYLQVAVICLFSLFLSNCYLKQSIFPTSTSTSTSTLTYTPTPSLTSTPSKTPTFTHTNTPTATSRPTKTPYPTPVVHVIHDIAHDVLAEHTDVLKIEYFIETMSKLKVIFYLRDIPPELNFHPEVPDGFSEHQWCAYIDVDNDSSTGEAFSYHYFGVDYAFCADDKHEAYGLKSIEEGISATMYQIICDPFQCTWRGRGSVGIVVDLQKNTLTLWGRILELNDNSRVFFKTYHYVLDTEIYEEDFEDYSNSDGKFLYNLITARQIIRDKCKVYPSGVHNTVEDITRWIENLGHLNVQWVFSESSQRKEPGFHSIALPEGKCFAIKLGGENAWRSLSFNFYPLHGKEEYGLAFETENGGFEIVPVAPPIIAGVTVEEALAIAESDCFSHNNVPPNYEYWSDDSVRGGPAGSELAHNFAKTEIIKQLGWDFDPLAGYYTYYKEVEREDGCDVWDEPHI